MEPSQQQPSTATIINGLVGQTAEHIRSSGIIQVDLDELKALKETAKAYIYAMAKPSFDESIVSDRLLGEDRRDAKQAIARLVDKRSVIETRLTNAHEQTARLPVPRRSHTGIVASGVGLFTICFAPTIYSVFMSSIQDAPLAWLISLLIGGAIGAFLVLVLLQPRGEAKASKHSSMVGFGLGIGFGILRLSKADGLEDYLIAIGLTVFECMAVAGLDWYAEKHRQCLAVYQSTQAPSIALERAVADVAANIAAESARLDALRAEQKQRDSETFDVERVAEHAAWAVEGAYRRQINANRRQLEGGGGYAFPQGS